MQVHCSTVGGVAFRALRPIQSTLLDGKCCGGIEAGCYRSYLPPLPKNGCYVQHQMASHIYLAVIATLLTAYCLPSVLKGLLQHCSPIPRVSPQVSLAQGAIWACHLQYFQSHLQNIRNQHFPQSHAQKSNI